MIMKVAYQALALLCVLPMFASLSFAQANSAAGPTPMQSPAAASASFEKEAPKKSAKVVPPEKAEPLKIPLFAKPP